MRLDAWGWQVSQLSTFLGGDARAAASELSLRSGPKQPFFWRHGPFRIWYGVLSDLCNQAGLALGASSCGVRFNIILTTTD